MSDEPLRVLLADDDADLRDPLAEYLRSDYAYHVDAAADAEEALQLVRAAQLSYHVALIDDMLSPGAGLLPIRSGVDLMGRIRAHSPRTEAIIFTGWGMKGALEALRAGAFRYLAKPFNAEELAITIRHAAQQHHLVKELDTLKLLGAISDQLNLNHLDLETLLQETITRATIIIGAHEGSLLVIKDDSSLQSWRSYGLPEMSVEKAEEIRSKGCAKWVLENCVSVRLDDFRADSRWRVLKDDPLQNGSALLVPLKEGNKAIGVLSFTASETHYFKEEHQILVESISSQAAIAIRHAALFKKTGDLAEELHLQKEKLDRFIACSPTGQIAIDTRGKIKFFNERAQQILGYTEEELIGKSVIILYQHETEARRIGTMLATDPNHIVRAERTDLATKDGRPVPVLLSATYWKDANGTLLGSIGHFENLTEIQKKNAQLAVLSEASKIMAEAATLEAGLADLVRLLVERLQRSFCSIFQWNENSQTLFSKVSHVRQAAGLGPDAGSSDEFKMKIANCTLLREIFEANACRVICHSDSDWQQELDLYAGYLRLKGPIQMLMLVPLMKDGRIVGLLTLGEVQETKAFPFATDETDLATATAIAHQITGLIDRLWQFHFTEYRNCLLEKLNTALLQIQGGMQIPKLEQEITWHAAETLSYLLSFLFVRRPGQVELELCQTFPENVSLPNNPSSEEGLLGEVVRTGKPQSKAGYDDWSKRERVFDQFHFKTILAVPLKPDEQVEYLLVVGSTDSKPFVETDEEMLERLAMRASLTLQNARLGEQKERVNKHLNILHQVSFYIQKMLADAQLTGAQRLERLLHVILTGVTAGYGLGFNRAAVFLLDEREEYLTGKCGIGQIDRETASVIWQELHSPKLEDFFAYTRLLERREIKETPISAMIRGLRLECGPEVGNVLGEVLQGNHPEGIVLEGEEILALPNKLLTALKPRAQIAVAPLTARGRVIGVLIADNNFNGLPITEDDLRSLITFVNAAAVAIENHNLLQQREGARRRQALLSRASSRLIAPQNPDQVLKSICEQTKKATASQFAVIILIDEMERPQRLLPDEIGSRLDVERAVTPNGISLEVMRTGQPIAISSLGRQSQRANSLLIDNGVKAAVCLPFFAQDRKHGVLWIAYDRPHIFSDQEVKSLQPYVNQAAGAYDNARRMDEMRHMRQAAEDLATSDHLNIVLVQIAELALEVLQADSAVIWSFDPRHGGFNLDESVVVGDKKDEIWARLKELAPSESGTTKEVLEKKWLGVEDVNDRLKYPFLTDAVRSLLNDMGVRAFQGIALMVQGDPLGILYVNHKRIRKFRNEETENARTFANHAALALRRARLSGMLKATRDTAYAVARVTTLGDLDTTLNRIAQGTKETTGCEPIVLFVYDQKKDSFRNPRTMVGVWNEPAASGEKVPRESIVYEIMRQGQTVKADDVSSHPKFKDTRFALEEDIKSCLAVPMQLGQESVGVLFVNNRTPHNFSDNEKLNIELFAHQAAVAIRNTRLYEALQKRIAALQTLHEAGAEITETLDEREVVQKIIRQVWKLANKEKAFASVRKVEGEEAVLVAYHPAPPPDDRPIPLKPGKGKKKKIGITGRAVRDKRSQLVGDVTADPDYIEYHSTTRTELTVPIIIDDKVVYVINLEHPELNAFDEEDRRDLESLATQAAIAIQNARKYESLIEANVKVKASTDLSWTNMASGVWHHQVEGKAVTIAGEIDLLLDDPDSNRLTKKQKMRLEKIKNLAEKVLNYKITPPISSEDGVTSISVNDLLTQLFSTRRENNPFGSVIYELELLPDDPLEVWISPDWLRIACDIVVDNAVRAVRNSPRKVVSATTSLNNGLVVIAIEDTGSGIPKKVFDKLFTGVISKEDGGEGLGIGLLEAQAIIKRYGGEIRIPWTNTKGEKTGTRVVIELPRQN
ncbi:MAG: GAF domain-containing protein [Acidobacteria bacterium]|nr:GAF domain-containing protein [Acidobacteriota bacterium]